MHGEGEDKLMQVQVPGSQEPLLSAMAPSPQTLQTPCPTGWGCCHLILTSLAGLQLVCEPFHRTFRTRRLRDVTWQNLGLTDFAEEVARLLCGQSAVSVCTGGRTWTEPVLAQHTTWY